VKNRLSIRRFSFLLLSLFLCADTMAQEQTGLSPGFSKATGKDSMATRNELSIKSGKISLAVDPNIGGRITSFKLGNYEFLVQRGLPFQAYGSTFWPSPQSNWNWPPPRVLDSAPYSVENGNGTIRLNSGKDSVTGFQFEKKFSAAKPSDSTEGNGGINLQYSMVNISNETRQASPWEITRVHKGGLLFFPIGEGQVTSKLFKPAPTEILDGIVWYQSNKGQMKENWLSKADGSEGWAAYAIGGELFIKKFLDVKPEDQAPGEAEVLFYTDANADVVEFEIQGKFETMKPGDKTSWNVEWIAAGIPLNIKVEKGSKELVEFVRKTISGK